MESFEREIKKYAIVINVNLIRATLNEAAEFREYLNEAIMGSEVDIIVNLSECLHLDSTFLGVLVSGYKKLKNKNRNLVIIEPTDQSRVFLTLNSIGKIFPLYDSVSSALEDIENKRMIENAVNNIEEETIELEAEVPVEKQQEEISEIQIEEINEEGNEEIPALEPVTENIDIHQEMNPATEVLNDLTTENLNENVAESSNYQVEAEEKSDVEISSSGTKPLYPDDNYKKGTVEWAFGFN